MTNSVWLVLPLVLLLPLATRDARAETPLDGSWSASAVSESYTVQQWLPGCGPAPVSGTAEGGGGVTVRADGDELVIAGAGRTFRTNQCLDPMPTLARVAHSRNPSGRAWSTRCATPAGDSRRATLNTLVQATSDTSIEIAETGRYEITLADGTCIADVRRSRSLRRAAPPAPSQSAPAATPTPEPTPTPTATPEPASCSAPGEPVRLEVRPSRKLLRSGEGFAFRAEARDAAGCSVKVPVQWKVEGQAPGVAIDSTGKVSLSSIVAEGAYTLVAASGEKHTKVTVEVVSSERYAELLAQPEWGSGGQHEAPAVVSLAGSLGTGGALVEDTSKRRRLVFLSVVGGLTCVLGIVALFGFRRARRLAKLEREALSRHEEKVSEFEERRRSRQATYEAELRAHEERKRARQEQLAGEAMSCPVCRREYPPGGKFCPVDRSALVPLREAPGQGGLVCPTCGRGFPAGTRLCPEHGEELIPPAVHQGKQPLLKARGKICPTCGDKFDAGAAFCGKDGTSLVLLN